MVFLLLALIFITMLQCLGLAMQAKRTKEQVTKLEEDVQRLINRVKELESNTNF